MRSLELLRRCAVVSHRFLLVYKEKGLCTFDHDAASRCFTMRGPLTSGTILRPGRRKNYRSYRYICILWLLYSIFEHAAIGLFCSGQIGLDFDG